MRPKHYRYFVIAAVALTGVTAASLFFGKQTAEPVRIRGFVEPEEPHLFSEDRLLMQQAAAVPAKSMRVLLTPKGEQQLSMIREILAAKNDNDPRLDRELRELEPGLREQLQVEYAQLAPEKRNERGTVVFLLGRNLTLPQDFQFMKQVLTEPACRSFTDCAKDAHVSHEDAHGHLDSADAISLAYPQWNALIAIEKVLRSPDATPDQRRWAEDALQAARRSENRALVSRAEEISRSLEMQR